MAKAKCVLTGVSSNGFWALFESEPKIRNVKGLDVPVREKKFFSCELDLSSFEGEEFDTTELKQLGIVFK